MLASCAACIGDCCFKCFHFGGVWNATSACEAGDSCPVGILGIVMVVGCS